MDPHKGRESNDAKKEKMKKKKKESKGNY